MKAKVEKDFKKRVFRDPKTTRFYAQKRQRLQDKECYHVFINPC